MPRYLELAPHPSLTSVARSRREQITNARLAPDVRVLEIGAFDNATVIAEDGVEVRYADYFSAEELKAKHVDNPRRRIAHVCMVDYVIKGPFLSAHIGEKFDLIIANHVIEHLPNTIGWLADIRKISSPGARLFLTVPDMRFCFDYLKRPTDAIDLIKSFDEGKCQPDVYDIARMAYHHVRVDAAQIWAGAPMPATPASLNRDLARTMADARRQAAQGYVDVHCNYYTRESFSSIFHDIYRVGLIPWKLMFVSDIRRDDCEFYVMLELST